MSIAKIVGQRNFANKLWNIARYTEDAIEGQVIGGTNHNLMPIIGYCQSYNTYQER